MQLFLVKEWEPYLTCPVHHSIPLHKHHWQSPNHPHWHLQVELGRLSRAGITCCTLVLQMHLACQSLWTIHSLCAFRGLQGAKNHYLWNDGEKCSKFQVKVFVFPIVSLQTGAQSTKLRCSQEIVLMVDSFTHASAIYVIDYVFKSFEHSELETLARLTARPQTHHLMRGTTIPRANPF